MPKPAKVVSAYTLKKGVSTLDNMDVQIEKEKKSLVRIFNLKNIKLITQGDMILKEKKSDQQSLMIVLNEKNFLIQMTLLSQKEALYKIEIKEKNGQIKSLLDTKLIIPQQKTAVLGFEDSSSKIYFLSLFRKKDPLYDDKPKVEYIHHQGPELVYRINPSYPRQARLQGIQGLVVLEGIVDKKGHIEKLSVVKGKYDILINEAIKAIKQWRYKPYQIIKHSEPVTFTITVNFILQKDQPASHGGIVNFTTDSTRLRFQKKVNPVYPREALESGIEGEVILGVIISKKGEVINTKVFRGNPVLARAALQAVKQWEFEPYMQLGQRKYVIVKVTVTFSLD
jgi:TonB family protein